jgi:NAD(P)H dehydrogenase (quinone)
MAVYAVTGASGHLGRLAIQELLSRDVPASNIVAIVRTRGKVADLAARGVQVREETMHARKPWARRWAVWSTTLTS